MVACDDDGDGHDGDCEKSYSDDDDCAYDDVAGDMDANDVEVENDHVGDDASVHVGYGDNDTDNANDNKTYDDE